jgi:RluA family pseudouridine synthase
VEYAIGVYLKCGASGEPVRIIHRLDRGTSGVMLFPKNRTAAARLSLQLKEGRVEKRYLALVSGVPPAGEWLVDQPIAKVGSARYGVARPGKEAQTGFRVVAQGDGAALVEARPFTGRTHQIRVHLAHCGLPIVGDSTYGGVGAARMMLHCCSRAFEGRDGGVITVTAGLDEEYRQICGQEGVFGF